MVIVCCHVAVCHQHPNCMAGTSLFWMVMQDGWYCRWWWWEGRSGVAMFEPCLLYLGRQVLRVGCIFLLFYVYQSLHGSGGLSIVLHVVVGGSIP